MAPARRLEAQRVSWFAQQVGRRRADCFGCSGSAADMAAAGGAGGDVYIFTHWVID